MTTTIINIAPISEKNKERAKIQAQVDAFLARGGSIEVKESALESSLISRAAGAEAGMIRT